MKLAALSLSLSSFSLYKERRLCSLSTVEGPTVAVIDCNRFCSSLTRLHFGGYLIEPISFELDPFIAKPIRPN